MSDNWKPSTEQVRSHYVFDQSDRWDPERGEAFDRWLAVHDREVAAQALEDAERVVRPTYRLDMLSGVGPIPIAAVNHALHKAADDIAALRSGTEGSN